MGGVVRPAGGEWWEVSEEAAENSAAEMSSSTGCSAADHGRARDSLQRGHKQGRGQGCCRQGLSWGQDIPRWVHAPPRGLLQTPPAMPPLLHPTPSQHSL